MSAAVRIAIGVVCFFGFTLAALLFLYAISPWIDYAEIPFFGSRVCDSALFGVAGLLAAFASVHLIQGKTWAYWTALAVSVITLGLGVLIFVSAFRARDEFARSEAGFGLGISLILTTPAAISGLLLSLPAVRRKFDDAGRPI